MFYYYCHHGSGLRRDGLRGDMSSDGGGRGGVGADSPNGCIVVVPPPTECKCFNWEPDVAFSATVSGSERESDGDKSIGREGGEGG